MGGGCIPADADDKAKTGLRLHKEVSVVLGLAAHADQVAFGRAVLLDVRLGLLEDGLALGLLGLG